MISKISLNVPQKFQNNVNASAPPASHNIKF